MAIPIASATISRFESRFFLNALIPTAVFLPLVSAVVLEATIGLDVVLAWLVELSAVLLLLVGAAAFAVVWLAAALLASQWANMVRLFEGYPLIRGHRVLVSVPGVGAMARATGVPGVGAHQSRRVKLIRRLKAGSLSRHELHLQYDESADHVLPTRLGNVLRAAELYPRNRYGIDATVFWSRLAFLLPEHILRDVERVISQYELPLVISAWATVLMISSSVPAIAGDVVLFRVTLVVGAGIAFTAYYLSLRSAVYYGMMIRTAFDLHRDLLHQAWPATLRAGLDKDDFERFRMFILTGDVAAEPVEVSHRQKDPGEQASAPKGQRDHSSSDMGGRVPSPRLSVLLAILIVVALVLGGWAAGRGSLVVAVANTDTPVFATVTFRYEDRQLSSFMNRIRGTALTRPEVAAGTYLATRSLEAGEVLARHDVVAVPHVPSVVLSVPQTGPLSDGLQLAPGDAVVVSLGGAYGGSTACAESPQSFVHGTVLAQVKDGSQGVVVGIEGQILSLECYGLADVRLLRTVD